MQKSSSSEMPRPPRIPQRQPGPPRHPARPTQYASLQQRLQEAIAFHRQGELAAARAIYEKILAGDPGHADSLHLLGLVLWQCGDSQRALDHIDRAIARNPGSAAYFSNRGNVLKSLMRLDDALASHDRAIALNPRFAEAHNNRGNVLKELGRLDDALASYERAIALVPDFADALTNKASVLAALKRFEEALTIYDRAIALRPDHADAHNNRGNVLRNMGRLNDALASYETAIDLRPDHASAHNNRGNVLKDMGRLDDSLKSYDLAISLQPDLADAHGNRGNVLLALKRLEAALASYDTAITLRPDRAEAHNSRGTVLREMGRLAEALASHEKAIGLRPDHAGAHNNRGNVLRDFGRLVDAVGSYDAAIAIQPDFADALSNRGNALLDLGDLDAALASYDRSIALMPNHAKAHNNRGNVLKAMGRLDDALSACERALALDPDCEYLPGNIAHLQCYLCDWTSRDQSIARLRAGVASGALVSTPFPLLALADDPLLQRQAAELFARKKTAGLARSAPAAVAARRERIHLAYLSADFHDHATAFLMAELFERHDRGRFELTAISFGPDSSDVMRQRLRSAFDRFIEVRGMGDAEVARLCNEIGVDIAIDLKGYTTDSRPGILAARCAPIQVNYLGYPGTMGAGFIDYLIADRVLIDDADLDGYSEKIIRLPGSYQANDRRRRISERKFTRPECGLPEEAMVYCCFNNNYKLSPETFDSWMRILGRVPHSVLWLFEDNPTAARNLRREAEKRGIAAERLVFASRLPLPEHLARHGLADLFLDTLPCNAHTTASDALWAGLPVLTLKGRSFAARVAASLNRAVGLPELTTGSREDYEQQAVALATHPDRLAAIKQRLADNRATCPLFDCEGFARHLEEAYVLIIREHDAGHAPRHISMDGPGDGGKAPANSDALSGT